MSSASGTPERVKAALQALVDIVEGFGGDASARWGMAPRVLDLALQPLGRLPGTDKLIRIAAAEGYAPLVEALLPEGWRVLPARAPR